MSAPATHSPGGHLGRKVPVREGPGLIARDRKLSSADQARELFEE